MTRRARLILDGIMLLIFLASLAPEATGVAFHERLGIALFAATFVHVVINWDWVLGVVARLFARIRATSKVRLVTDALLFSVTVTVTLSGLLISEALTSVIGLTGASGPIWSVLHSLSARVAVVLLIVHVGQHAAWISSTLRSIWSDIAPVGVRP